jgi:hypothetical protein
MWPCNLSPHDSNLRATDLFLRTVDESDLLAEVESCCLWVFDALNLNQTGVGVGVALSTLIAQMPSPIAGPSA